MPDLQPLDIKTLFAAPLFYVATITYWRPNNLNKLSMILKVLLKEKLLPSWSSFLVFKPWTA